MIMADVIKFNCNPYPQYFFFLENHVNELIFIPKFKIGWTTNGLKKLSCCHGREHSKSGKIITIYWAADK